MAVRLTIHLYIVFLEKIAVSGIEHQSILNYSKVFHRINIIQDGTIDLNHLESILQNNDIDLVSVMLANNEVGTIQPIKEIKQLCEKYNALLHSDCVQALGRISYSTLQEIFPYIDFITACFHKCGGMLGVATLITPHKNLLKPLIYGGDQEHKLRASTENTLLIATLPTILEQIRHCDDEIENYQHLREQIISAVPTTLDIQNAIPNTLAIHMPEVDRQTQLMHFDMNDIAVGIGSACSSGSTQESYVLKAMDYSKKEARCAIRVSMGWNTTAQCVTKFIENWRYLYEKTCLS